MTTKEERQRSLLAKHQGIYIPVSTIEHHYLPYELKLAKLSREKLSKYSPYDFLFKPLPGSPNVELNLPGLKQACENLFDNQSGESEYENTIKTINKKITTLTKKSLSYWQNSQYFEDAFKMTYLLFKLQKTLPMGLDVYSKGGDERYSEIELFTSHHEPTNKKDEFDHIQLLSAWIKEIFCNILFQRSEIERGVLKNLDLIHSGYTRVISEEVREGRGYKLLRNDVFKRPPVEEELSITLLRKYNDFTKSNNINTLENSNIIKIIDSSYKDLSPLNLSEPDLKLAKDSSIIFSKAILKDIYRTSKPESYTNLANIQLKNFSNIIYDVFKRVLSIKKPILVAKRIGSTGSHRTSIRNSLHNLVDKNKKIINMRFCVEDIINMNEYCSTHYKALESAAIWAIRNKSYYIDNNEHDIEFHSKISEKVSCYLERMTPREIFDDMERIREITMESDGNYISILAPASGLPSINDLYEIKKHTNIKFNELKESLRDEVSYNEIALKKLVEMQLKCAPKPAVVLGHITSFPMENGITEASWIVFDSDNPIKSEFLDLLPPSKDPDEFINRERAQRLARNYVVDRIVAPRHDHRCAFK
ncbi:hypothetical protein [Vibrio sp. WZ-1]|uniref:hypothetical protein n=1 Tax=Vibrio sp. WZ-1 TaxID=3454501 RepID=UPI003F83EE7F